MKPLAVLALSLPLAAQGSLSPYLPGHDKDLYHRVKAAEATVEIRGALDPEEIRQLRFQEFMAWFLPDLHSFLSRYGGVAAAVPEAIKLTEPPPQARTYPMGGASF